jgi:hypothetical protein
MILTVFWENLGCRHPRLSTKRILPYEHLVEFPSLKINSIPTHGKRSHILQINVYPFKCVENRLPESSTNHLNVYR